MLRRLINTARRRGLEHNPRASVVDGRGLVERCLNLERDPLLALDLAVSVHEAIQASRAGLGDP